MKLIKEQIKELALRCLIQLNPALSELDFEVDYPANAKFGDYSTNAALKAAKLVTGNPLEIADKLVSILSADAEAGKLFGKIEAIKPGFINFYFSPVFLSAKVEEILALKGNYGRSDIGQGEKIQLEFISANPTGPLTVGNGRGGFFGNALGNVLRACGFDVTKEYLINDAGNQILALGHSVLKDEQAVYKGDYINDLHVRITGDDPYRVGQQAAKIILEEMLKPTIAEGMKVGFDVWFSENEELRQTKKIDRVIKWLKKENHLYEQDGAWWFKSSEHGDTRDRVLVKSNGEFTYLAQDFAYLVSKFKERKFSRVINIWGADHHGDVAGLLAAADVLGYKDRQEVLLIQFVKLFKDGQEVRMSKRAGTYVAMSELLEIVGHDAVRFLFLMYSNNTHISFNLNLAQERSEKNPVYYVQYAHARICGILRQKEVMSAKPSKNDLAYVHQAELSLLKLLLRFPEILSQVALDYEAQKLPNYALEIADKFHQFYNYCRVIDEGKINPSRLALVKLTKKILGEVLAVIGISAPEKM